MTDSSTSGPTDGTPEPQWPRKEAVCLDCRTALDGSGGCPVSARHRTARLDDPHGREDLLTAVWGPPSRRARARRAAKAGGSGAASGAALGDCGSCSGCDAGALDPEALLVIAVLALAFVIIYFVGSFLLRLYRRYRARLIPNGAAAAGLSAGHGRGQHGTVVATAAAPAPITGASCVAYGQVLRHKQMWRTGKVTLRDSATIGFDVALDSGERVRIPAGLIALDMRAATPVSARPEDIESYLTDLDQQRQRETPDEHGLVHETVPCTEVRQVVIADGARVVVRGRLEPRPDNEALPGHYRDQAPTVLVPVDVPRIALEA